ncbi:hypothetical protein [Corynebacterium diphtheriae]|uniref:hypothetical protein n=1 Tax=Corynebacterium diphtheriae TaxID=1717 RepID=UPI000B4BAFDC|nr:hypothetical protein [Corynebacterium diphtheriae]MBG9306436.1 hypothetical protein [Corynebacterium diphtheriae bv. mitis]OWN22807.1 hypothetical protein AY495_00550 [Corynebacterium diphtheriae bv. mitis]OWN30275.1 hypothetical protein AY487_03740 [Corynebacterium diphtheriae bv. mitis]OWO66021.1 hypothetical protein AY483_08170 [Corynebacterium diphtheriae bv. mitis]CAB0830344.1 hypothetical protein FRC0326_00108 [Corynebacterium diphtheriae]
MTIYTSTTDYITAVVAPALTHCDGDYDHEAIAAAMTEWREEKNANGEILLDKSGLVEREDVDFWEIVAENEIA